MTTTPTQDEELPLSVKQAAAKLHAARAVLKEASDAFLKTVEDYGKQKKATRTPAPLPQEDEHHA